MKNLPLTFSEALALLDMSVCSPAKADDAASASALAKLANLCNEFAEEQRPDPAPANDVLPRAA